MPDSAFDFTNRCRPLVEIGIGNTSESTGPARWDSARWDRDPNSTWGGDEPQWHDVSCHVIEARLRLGRGRVTDPFMSDDGCVVLVDNRSGWADPEPKDTQGRLTMRPGRQIRVGVEHIDMGVVWLWRGFVDALTPLYEALETEEVELRCIDALGEVGRAVIAGVNVVGRDETASARFQRLLNVTPWRQSKRKVAESNTPMVGMLNDGQLADLLRQTSDSAGGHCFGDTEGDVVLKSRDWMFFRKGDPDDGTIGNGVDGAVCPGEWVRPFDRSDMATRVVVDRSMPPDATVLPEPRVHNDRQGQIRYGVEPWEKRDLWTRDDADIDRIARRVLATRSAQTMPRVQAVTLDAPGANPAATDKVVDLLTALTIFKPSRYRCRLELERGVVFDDTYFAVGVLHEISRERWHAEISLDRADLFELDADQARWDRSGWDRSTWN